MARLNLHTWGATRKVTLRLDHYVDNDNLYVGILCEDGEPWSDLTVNLDIKCRSNCAFIDINNNSANILTWLEENNLGKLTGELGFSGYCVYPEFEFDMDEVNKYVEE